MKLLKIIKNNIVYILIMVLIFAVSRCFSIGLATGESMSPTIPSPSILLINKLDKDLQRNDIVVCKEGGLKTITKRIIGLPGETVEIRDGHIYIDGSSEPLEDVETKEYMVGNYGPYTVPEGCYFVMGDNRPYSKDSRYVGPVKKSQIFAKKMLVLLPISDIGVKD